MSVVTDPKLFKEATRKAKIASYWHQEVHYIGGIRRKGPVLNIAHEVGTLGVVGHLIFDNAVMVGPDVGKAEAQAAGPVVFGQDGVLFKSEIDPPGGKIFHTPEGVYLINDTVHRAADSFPRGRVFFQMDAGE